MHSTARAESPARKPRAGFRTIAVGLGVAIGLSYSTANSQEPIPMARILTTRSEPSQTLDARQKAIVPIAAYAAAGDIERLNQALNLGLDAGLTISDAKEILVQLYAYAGFPRSLNALGELMKVLDSRKQRGVHDAAG